jgi:hypothetical protein
MQSTSKLCNGVTQSQQIPAGRERRAAALRRLRWLLGKARAKAVRLSLAACPALIGRRQLSLRFCRSV